MLNSPSPNSGAYILEHKISNELWNTYIKHYATYYNADFLNECDMFYSEPGWRIGKQAIEKPKKMLGIKYLLTTKKYRIIMKDITVRISEAQLQKLDELFRYRKEGVEVAIDSFIVLRRVALAQFKGVFTESELSALVDCFNATMLTKSMQAYKETILAQVQDSDKYEGLYSKWAIDTESFEGKINRLTELQSFFLQEELYRFWNGAGYGYPMPELEKFLANFVK